MFIISNTIYVLTVLSLMVILAIYTEKTQLGRRFGAALLVILFCALLSNFNLIPSASNSIELYSVIFNYVAPISIFYLLLSANLNSIKKAGVPMLSLFLIGSFSTTLGILISWIIISPESSLGEDAKVIAGMLTGTYTGGSINFNAVALEYGFQKKGVLYAGTIAVDNVVTALWILVSLTLPMILSRFWKSKLRLNEIDHKENVIIGKEMDLASFAWLIFLGFFAFYLTELLALLFPKIPSILILSSIGIGLAQTEFISKLKGAQNFGLYLVYLFLGVIVAYCEFNAVYELKDVGVSILLFTSMAVLIHGILIIFIGGLLYRDWQMIAIASQANIGGGASVIALAETFKRKDLILPSILLGALGNAIGSYLGFLVIYVL